MYYIQLCIIETHNIYTIEPNLILLVEPQEPHMIELHTCTYTIEP